MRFLPLLLIAACGSLNGNGHDQVDHGVDLKDKKPQLVTSWWCHSVSGDTMTELDGQSACDRLESACEKSRQAAQLFGFTAGSCTKQEAAVCLMLTFADRNEPMERCFSSGEHCEQVRASHSGRTDVDASTCAIVTPDVIPGSRI